MKSKYLLFLFLISSYFYAQNGQIDLTFGTNGMKNIYTDLYDYASQDKILFGNTITNSTPDIVYLTNDKITRGVMYSGNCVAFSDHVTVWDQITYFNDGIFESNKIYGTGYTSKDDDNKAFFVFRLIRGTGSNNTRWYLDTSFNIDGKIVFDTNEVDEESVAIKLAADNKFFITGYSGSKGIVAKYTSDGFLDKTFNQGGFCKFQFGLNCKPTSMVVQPDDKVVIAGNCFNGTDTDFFITRYNTDGTLDTSFGANGVIIKDVNSHDNTGNSLVIASDGSLLVAGKAYGPGNSFGCTNAYGYSRIVFRFDTNGQLMTSFTNGAIPGAYVQSGCYVNGTQSTILDSEIKDLLYNNGWVYGICDQKQLNSPYGTVRSFQVPVDALPNTDLTYNMSGPAVAFNVNAVSVAIKPSDNTFYSVVKYDNCAAGGQSTFLKTPTGNFFTSCNANNKITIKKIIKSSTGYYVLDINKRLFKLDSNFNIDKSFATIGYLSDVLSFNVDLNDKVICNLDITDNYSNKVLIVRYNPNGKIDLPFGLFGKIISNQLFRVDSITITPQNDYLITKNYGTNPGTLYVVKINNAGETDSTFGVGGILTLSTVPTSSNFSFHVAAEDLAMDVLGNYYALAYAYNGVSNYSTKIIKFSPNGVIDTSFGSNGIANVEIALNASYKINFAINNTTGKLLVYNKNNLVQLNANGTIDTSFGTNGAFDLSTLATDFNTGSIVVKGADYYIGGTSNANAIIFKMNSSAVLDPSFGTNSGYFLENGLSNPAYVPIKDMFFYNPDTILIYSALGLKKIQ
jgi:uncharacterized delta-60 repeat protein